MVVFDHAKKKLVEFSTSDKFNLKTLNSLLHVDTLRKLRHEKYNNDDYEILDRDLSDKKFKLLKPDHKNPDSDASSFDYEQVVSKEKKSRKKRSTPTPALKRSVSADTKV